MWFQKPPLGTPLDWENPLNDGTALALAMNEGHGDHLQDLSMNGNHGKLNGFAFPPTVASGWNPGQTGVGLNFDGTNDVIGCGNASSVKIYNGTISALIKTDDAGAGYRGIILKTNAFSIFCVDNVFTVYDWSAPAAHSSGVNVADGKPHCNRFFQKWCSIWYEYVC